jgi:phosphomannomutase
MSAHHYFRDFGYCDSGMVPWLLVSQIISRSGKTLSQLVGERMSMYPASGEINRRVKSVEDVLDAVGRRYQPAALGIDRTDGLSMEFDTWRFNLRGSNTEPVIRLNVETRGDAVLMTAKTEELSGLIRAQR